MAKISPSGRVWLPKTLESLDLLSEEERQNKRLAIDFSLAHSKFDFGDYDGAIVSLAKVLETSIAVGNDEKTSMVFFTTARAYLHLYLGVPAQDTWNAC